MIQAAVRFIKSEASSSVGTIRKSGMIAGLILAILLIGMATAQALSLSDNFDDGDDIGWVKDASYWTITNAVHQYYGNAYDNNMAISIFDNAATRSGLIIETDFYINDDPNIPLRNAAIVFDYQTESNYKVAMAKAGAFWRINHIGSVPPFTPCDFPDPTISVSRWYRMRVTINGSDVALDVDDLEDGQIGDFAYKGSCSFNTTIDQGKTGLRVAESQAYFDNFSLQFEAQDFYVAVNGNNDNDGSLSSPWKTIGKVNETTFNPGDRVHFKCGDEWREQLNVPSSGTTENKITFTSYGDNCDAGNKPLIKASTSITGWTQDSGNIYVADVSSLPGAVKQLFMDNLTEDDFQYIRLAQHPNPENANYLIIDQTTAPTKIKNPTMTCPDKDFKNTYTYYSNFGIYYFGPEPVSPNDYIACYYSISDSPYDDDDSKNPFPLPSDCDVSGAGVHVRTYDWFIDYSEIDKYEADKLLFKYSTRYQPQQDYGYYLDNKLCLLDSPGEWYYDAAPENEKLYVWTPNGESPDTYLIEASIQDYGILIDKKDHIVISGLQIEHAANSAIKIEGSSDFTLQYLDIIDSGGNGYHDGSNGRASAGGDGIHTNQSDGGLIDHTKIINSVNEGIQLRYSKNITITNNEIENSGTVGSPKKSHGAIDIYYCGSDIFETCNIDITSNKIVNSGYHGIGFSGDGFTVMNNVVERSCLVLDDCGGIYTWNGFPGNSIYHIPDNQTTIAENIVVDSIGNRDGATYKPIPISSGIYLDDQSNKVTVQDNTIVNASYFGVYLNNAFNNIIDGNTLYGNGNFQIAFNEGDSSKDDIHDVVVINNIMFPKNLNESVYIRYPEAEDADFFIPNSPTGFNFNTYSLLYSDKIVNETNSWGESELYTLGDWQALPKYHDLDSFTFSSPENFLPRERPYILTNKSSAPQDIDCPDTGLNSYKCAQYKGMDGSSIQWPYTLSQYNSKIIVWSNPCNSVEIPNNGKDDDCNPATPDGSSIFEYFDNHDNWLVVSGTWETANGMYSHPYSDFEDISYLNLTDLPTKTVIETDFYADNNAAIVFDYHDAQNYKFVVANIQSQFWRIGGVCTIPDTIYRNKWYRMRVDINGNTVSLYVDDLELKDNVKPGFVYKGQCSMNIGNGKIGLRVYSGTAYFDEFVIYYDHDDDGYTSDVDSDDNDAAIHPGAPEICDGIDNDCDGQTDESGGVFFYQDADADGYGNPNATIHECSGVNPTGYLADNTDCNDGNAAINPGMTEILDNGINESCSTMPPPAGHTF